MISRTPYRIELSLIKTARTVFDGSYTINEPSGRFFYDTWVLKPEFIGTVCQTIYESLPEQKGEARVIRLVAGEGYISHADIDDRYHLNLRGKKSYLIDLEKNIMHSVETDGQWYSMDAGVVHTAVNFGNSVRDQLVVRQLLNDNQLDNPVSVTITSNIADLEEARYIMDNTISPWLNRANKNKLIANFNHDGKSFTLDVELEHLPRLQELCTDTFSIVYQ